MIQKQPITSPALFPGSLRTLDGQGSPPPLERFRSPQIESDFDEEQDIARTSSVGSKQQHRKHKYVFFFAQFFFYKLFFYKLKKKNLQSFYAIVWQKSVKKVKVTAQETQVRFFLHAKTFFSQTLKKKVQNFYAERQYKKNIKDVFFLAKFFM